MTKLLFLLHIFVSSLFLWVLVSACSSSPKVNYYSLYSTPPGKSVEKSKNSIVLSVGPVKLPDVLNTPKIATGGTDGVYNFSESHRWTGAVDSDFAHALAETLAIELDTEKIGIYPVGTHLKPNCRVLIEILAMDGDLGKEARLTVRWTLIDPHGKMEPIIQRSQLSGQLSDAGYGTWVKRQHDNIQQLGVEIATLVRERFTP